MSYCRTWWLETTITSFCGIAMVSHSFYRHCPELLIAIAFCASSDLQLLSGVDAFLSLGIFTWLTWKTEVTPPQDGGTREILQEVGADSCFLCIYVSQDCSPEAEV